MLVGGAVIAIALTAHLATLSRWRGQAWEAWLTARGIERCSGTNQDLFYPAENRIEHLEPCLQFTGEDGTLRVEGGKIDAYVSGVAQFVRHLAVEKVVFSGVRIVVSIRGAKGLGTHSLPALRIENSQLEYGLYAHREDPTFAFRVENIQMDVAAMTASSFGDVLAASDGTATAYLRIGDGTSVPMPLRASTQEGIAVDYIPLSGFNHLLPRGQGDVPTAGSIDLSISERGVVAKVEHAQIRAASADANGVAIPALLEYQVSLPEHPGAVHLPAWGERLVAAIVEAIAARRFGGPIQIKSRVP